MIMKSCARNHSRRVIVALSSIVTYMLSAGTAIGSDSRFYIVPRLALTDQPLPVTIIFSMGYHGDNCVGINTSNRTYQTEGFCIGSAGEAAPCDPIFGETPGSQFSWYVSRDGTAHLVGGYQHAPDGMTGYLVNGSYFTFSRGTADDGGPVALSDGGAWAAGEIYDGDTGVPPQAAYWDPSRTMHRMGYLQPYHTHSETVDISADGQTIIGESGFNEGYVQPFVWRMGEGMRGLPSLSSLEWYATYVNAMSADGTYIVGSDRNQSGRFHAARWGPGDEVIDLGNLPGQNASLANDVSDDGQIVVGNTNRYGFVWTSSLGMMNAHDYLAYNGVEVPSHLSIYRITHISGDGLTIGGMATSDLGTVQHAFLATCIPCFVDFNLDGGVDGADVESFYHAWQAGEPVADVNRDGGTDGADVETFFTKWSRGGC
jgi:hypothetical protein